LILSIEVVPLISGNHCSAFLPFTFFFDMPRLSS